MKRAHEHFCSGCLGTGPNASGWYRCTNTRCTKPALADCPEHSYTEVTTLDAAAIAAVSPAKVTYPVASPQKRFAGDVQSARKITEKQRAFLWRIAWTYRRQITDQAVLNEARAAPRRSIPSNEESIMTIVQYMRPYSKEELQALHERITDIFEPHPPLVQLGVLAVHLKAVLKDGEEEPDHVPPPPEVAELIRALEKATPFLAGTLIRGLECDESVS